MVDMMKESRGVAIGFAVEGQLTADDIHTLQAKLDAALAEQRKPMGLLIDLTAMHGATWAARWDEMRFLQTHTDHIARMAVVSDDKWEEIAEMTMVASAALQAETRYFLTSEIHQAWHWVRMSDHLQPIPARVMYPGKGLFGDYTPEYVGI